MDKPFFQGGESINQSFQRRRLRWCWRRCWQRKEKPIRGNRRSFEENQDWNVGAKSSKWDVFTIMSSLTNTIAICPSLSSTLYRNLRGDSQPAWQRPWGGGAAWELHQEPPCHWSRWSWWRWWSWSWWVQCRVSDAGGKNLDFTIQIVWSQKWTNYGVMTMIAMIIMMTFLEQRRHTNIRVARSQKGKSKQWPELGIGKVVFVKDNIGGGYWL